MREEKKPDDNAVNQPVHYPEACLITPGFFSLLCGILIIED
jgi:hypothetical protein